MGLRISYTTSRLRAKRFLISGKSANNLRVSHFIFWKNEKGRVEFTKKEGYKLAVIKL